MFDPGIRLGRSVLITAVLVLGDNGFPGGNDSGNSGGYTLKLFKFIPSALFRENTQEYFSESLSGEVLVRGDIKGPGGGLLGKDGPSSNEPD